MLTPPFMAQRKQMMMFHKNRSTLKHRVLCIAPKEEEKKKKKIVISEDLVAFARKSFSSLQLLRSTDVSMMIPLYKKPSTGPMLAGFPCLQNIMSLRFLKNP